MITKKGYSLYEVKGHSLYEVKGYTLYEVKDGNGGVVKKTMSGNTIKKTPPWGAGGLLKKPAHSFL